MNRDLEIKKDLDRGMSQRKVAEKYGVSRKVVENIIKQGRYYFDINSGEIVFGSKTISQEEQMFNYLYSYNETANNSVLSKNIAVTNTLLADYLSVNRSQTNRWSKKPQRLFGCDSKGRPNELFVNCIDDFNNFLEDIGNEPTKKINAESSQGLYFLYQDNILKYIGKSKNIKKRLYQHSYCSHIEGLKGEYDVKTIKVDNEVDLEIMERVYIKLLHPPLNIDFSDDREMGEVFKNLLDLVPAEYSCKIKIKEW